MLHELSLETLRVPIEVRRKVKKNVVFGVRGTLEVSGLAVLRVLESSCPLNVRRPQSPICARLKEEALLMLLDAATRGVLQHFL